MANLALQAMMMKTQEGKASTGYNNSTPEAASQTFSDGALVVIVGGGVTECGANPVRIDGVATGNANNYATQGTDLLHNHGFTMPNDDVVYEISIDQASAQGGAGAQLPITAIGKTFGVTKDTIGSSPAGTPLYWYLDVDKSASNQRVLVHDFPAYSPPGTVNGRVNVKFLSAFIIQ